MRMFSPTHELLALQLGDVDFLRRTVKVERQVSRDGTSFCPPKTDKSRRTVPLAADVAPVLSEHIRLFPPNADGVIFTTNQGNSMAGSRFAVDVFKPAVIQTGLPEGTGSHDLRHHFAAVLLRRLVPAHVVAKYLGHSSAALVLRTYNRIIPDAADLVRITLASAWGVTDVSPDTDQGTAFSV